MFSLLTNIFNRIFVLNSPTLSEPLSLSPRPHLPNNPTPSHSSHPAFCRGEETLGFLFCLIGNILEMGSNEIQERMSADIKMKQIKKRRSSNIFKVALFMMRRGKSSRKTGVHPDVASKSLWRKLFGSTTTTTTLRLENGKSDAVHHPIHTTKVAAIVPEVVDDDVKKPLPPSTADFKVEKSIVENPQSSPSCASSSSGSEESRYASAMNLRDLDACEEEDENDNGEEDDDEDCEFDDSAGDSMIDVKAEMFIAQFYEQMRLQNTETQMIRG